MLRITLMGGAALALACGGGGGEIDTEPIAGAWTAEIVAIGESGHSGFSTVSILGGGETRVNATLSGGSQGGVHSWGVYEGTCDDEGGLVGDAELYPALTPNELGNASATATIPNALSREEPYAIRVFQSEERDTLVGCGELVPSF